jgi:hypothetical protein
MLEMKQTNVFLERGFQYFENMERAPIKVPIDQDILFEEACKKHFASDWSGIGDDFDDDDFDGFWRQEPSTRLYWYVGALKFFCSGVEYEWCTFGWSIGCYLRYYAMQDAEQCEPDTVKWLAVLLNGLHFVSLEKPTFGMVCLLEKLFLPSDDWIASCGGEFDPDILEFFPDHELRYFFDFDRLRSLVARK